MRLLLDDTLPAELVQRLQLLNHDVATVGTHPELRGAPDAVVFASACRELRALVTTNAVDFLVLAGEHDHSGLVVTTVQRVSGKAGRDVCVRALQALETDLEQGTPTTHFLA